MTGGIQLNVTSGNREIFLSESQPVLVGLIGRGILKSRTPAMHMREGRRLGVPYIYKFLDTDLLEHADLGSIVDHAQFFGFAGLNITFPYKQEILSHLDEVSPDARRIGSVNTVVFKDGKRIGYNTDFSGFAKNVEMGLGDISGNTVLLIGAGGAGLAVAEALAQCKVKKLLIHDSDAQKSESLVSRFASQVALEIADASQLEAAAKEADGIVNATPVGMAKLPGMPISEDYMEKRHFIADIIYFPLETELLRTARKIGCRTLTGEGMAVFQAVKAFELFSGQIPDPDEMSKTFKSFDEISAADAAE